MIKKLKPVYARAVIETRRPRGLFYAYENGVYVGIDNSAGHAWTEEFASLRQCKAWLRNPSVTVQPEEQEENGMYRIAKPEELTAVAMKQGIVIDTHEADMVIGYLEGHGYCLVVDGEGRTARHDDEDGGSEDVPYSVHDAIMFCQEMNGELLRENESKHSPDTAYLCKLGKDEQALDALMGRIADAPFQCTAVGPCTGKQYQNSGKCGMGV